MECLLLGRRGWCLVRSGRRKDGELVGLERVVHRADRVDLVHEGEDDRIRVGGQVRRNLERRAEPSPAALGGVRRGVGELEHQIVVELPTDDGADGVMVGRAAQGNPWIFYQLTHFLETGEELPGPSLQERAAVIIRHLDLLLKYKGEYVGPREMRKHATWYTRGITHGAILRDRFNKAATREDFKAILDEFFGGYSAE